MTGDGARAWCIATKHEGRRVSQKTITESTYRIAGAGELLDGNHEFAGILFLGLCHDRSCSRTRRNEWLEQCFDGGLRAVGRSCGRV